MHAYVINLARSLDRRVHITAELKKTGMDYEIVMGVDGRGVDLNDPGIVEPSLPTKIVLPEGSVGCALSHLNVYRKIIKDGLDKALVLEDDAMLPADLGNLADAVGEQLVGAEVALLSVDSPEPCKLSRDGSIKLPSGRVLALPIDVFQPRSGAAYIITRAACERMLEAAPPIWAHADAWWLYYREGMLDRVRCVVPLPVVKCPKFVSTMGSYSLGDGLRGRLVRPLASHKIPLIHQTLAFRRRRILQQWSRVELVSVPFVERPSRLE